MSFLTSTPKIAEPPAVPQKGDAENAAMMEKMKQNRRKGFTSTILTSPDMATEAPTKKKTLLGE